MSVLSSVKLLDVIKYIAIEHHNRACVDDASFQEAKLSNECLSLTLGASLWPCLGRVI